MNVDPNEGMNIDRKGGMNVDPKENECRWQRVNRLRHSQYFCTLMVFSLSFKPPTNCIVTLATILMVFAIFIGINTFLGTSTLCNLLRTQTMCFNSLMSNSPISNSPVFYSIIDSLYRFPYFVYSAIVCASISIFVLQCSLHSVLEPHMNRIR